MKAWEIKPQLKHTDIELTNTSQISCNARVSLGHNEHKCTFVFRYEVAAVGFMWYVEKAREKTRPSLLKDQIIMLKVWHRFIGDVESPYLGSNLL